MNLFCSTLMKKMIQVYLKPGKEVPVLRFHPWIFSGAIARIDGQPVDGDVVEVYDRSKQLLGVGHFHHGSIAVRLLSFGPADVQELAFWVQKLRQAKVVRDIALHSSATTDCYRLVHGEGDGLSGLIVDVYGPVAVIQCHSIGMHRQRVLIAEALREVLGENLQAIYNKSYESLPPKYAEDQANNYLWSVADAPPENMVVHENGVAFRVNWVTGQKTGFFLDQRDNRQLLARYAAGKTVLNTFCYTGGFSCYALQAGAALVHSVDVSAKAMELTAENVELNRPFPGQHEGYTEDVLRFLKNEGPAYEVMIVDPPAYAKSI